MKEHPEWQAALRRRGIDDLDRVQIDPWPAGSFGVAARGRSADQPVHLLPARATAATTATPGRSRACIAFVDLGAGEVLEVRRPRRRADAHRPGCVPAPTTSDRCATTSSRSRSCSPTAPSFTVDGNLVRWQRWSLRVSASTRTRGSSCTPSATTTVAGCGPILHRASISRDGRALRRPRPDARLEERVRRRRVGPRPHGATRSQLGCDCLGEIRYLDAVLRRRAGTARTTIANADLHPRGGLRDPLEAPRPARRHRPRCGDRAGSSSASIATVGNYEYGFYWYFYLDGTIQLEVKLTGIMSTDGDRAPVSSPTYANVIAPGLAAPHHQHLFCGPARPRRRRAGERGATRSTSRPVPAGADNPWGNAFRPRVTPLASELGRAGATSTPRRSRTWQIVNPRRAATRSASPSPTSSSRRVDPDAARRRRTRASAGGPAFATPQPVGHAVRADERRAAGEFPNQHAGGDGLPAVDRRRPVARRHRRRALVHVRRHPRRRAPRTGR